MQLGYYFEVVSDAYTTIDVDDDELEKPWDEMTDEEKQAVAENYEDEAYHKAACECDESLGQLSMVEDENGKLLYSNC
jgi:hypothetical protein